MASEYAQRKDGWCGPAALSYALSLIGIDIDQEAIAKETGTTVTEGVDPQPLIKAAKKYGADVEIKNGDKPEETLKELIEEVKEGKSVIVDYLVSGDKDGGHYVVFLGQKQGRINIWNPSGGKKELMDKSYFITNWKDKTESGKTMKNWAMVIGA